jgi:hypothetical protein
MCWSISGGGDGVEASSSCLLKRSAEERERRGEEYEERGGGPKARMRKTEKGKRTRDRTSQEGKEQWQTLGFQEFGQELCHNVSGLRVVELADQSFADGIHFVL